MKKKKKILEEKLRLSPKRIKGLNSWYECSLVEVRRGGGGNTPQNACVADQYLLNM